MAKRNPGEDPRTQERIREIAVQLGELTACEEHGTYGQANAGVQQTVAAVSLEFPRLTKLDVRKAVDAAFAEVGPGCALCRPE
jgi:hypothetical protein